MYKYFIFSLLFVLVLLAGCGENPNKPLDKSQTRVKSTGNEHLKEIIWQTDGTKMALISEDSFQMGDALKDPEEPIQWKIRKTMKYLHEMIYMRKLLGPVPYLAFSVI